MAGKKTSKNTRINPPQPDLAAVKRELKKETVRRQATERSLKKSKERAAQLIEQSRLLRE